MNRVQNTKIILWIITGLAAAVGITRFIFGLGVTTNLNDTTPWGLWIGFDVMAGVALAAGGFIMTAIFYIMKREEFQPFVKPAVLTAFLGYLAVIVGLLFDVGLPWNLWHMIIFWNPHSPLFEVGWCVMLYSAVLLLEFSPVALEKFSRYAKIRQFLMKFRFVFVLLGIMLSTLHQSSLGSLFLVMPYKVHPLWYSSILPVEFLISAAALGLMMVALESKVSHWLYRHEQETELIAKLGKAAVWVLTLYFVVKISDIAFNNKAAMIFEGSWESYLFLSEIFISILIPVIIFSISKLRKNSVLQGVGAFCVVFGMIFNRINVGGITMLRATGDSYIPSWMEFSISFGVISIAGLVFLYVIEHFHIWDKQPDNPEFDPHTLPKFDYTSQTWLGTPESAALTKYSLAFVLSFALGLSLIPSDKITNEGVETITVRRANGKEILHINGNRDHYNVEFPHASHIERLGKGQCLQCHHLNLPKDEQNNCWECHKNMYQTADFFRHDWHSSHKGANLKCLDCHEVGKTKSSKTVKECASCHPVYQLTSASEKYHILSYTDAMHKLCVSCHYQEREIAKKAHLSECKSCHDTDYPAELTRNLKWDITFPQFNHVILPVIDSTRAEPITMK